MLTQHEERNGTDATEFAAAPESGRLVTDLWRSSFFDTLKGRVLFWALLLGFGAVRAYIGLSGVRVFPHDAFMVLDGAWRMEYGQRPHLDFNSMIGPVAYLPTVVGSMLSGNTITGFGYGQAIVAILLGAWAFVLGKGMAGTPRVLFALAVAALAGSPSLVGMTPFALTPGMSYNRYSYALLGLVLLECFRRPERGEFAGGCSSGVAFGLLLFLKMTGVFVAGFLVAGLWWMRPQTGRRWTGLAAGALLSMLPFAAYLRFQLPAVWRDLQMTAAAKHMVVYDRFEFGSIFFEAAMAMLIVWIAAFLLRQRSYRSEGRQLIWCAVVVIFASLALLISNFQHASLPLLTLLLILVGETVVAFVPAVADLQPMRMVCLTGAGIFVGVLGVLTLSSLVAGLGLKLFVAPHRPHFQARALASFVPVGDEIPYTLFVNDGLQLLNRYRHPGERVMSMDFTNPFSLALQLPPAPGGSTNLQYQGSFDDRHKVPAERLFGEAELVMWPRQYTDPSLIESVPRLYGPYLHDHFAFVGASDGWELYRRR